MTIRRSLVAMAALFLGAAALLGAWLVRERSGGAWHRVPLDRHEGRLEGEDGTPRGSISSARTLELFGSGLPDPMVRGSKVRFGSRVWGVEAPPETRMVWKVPLGRRPTLSFRPLRDSASDCEVRYLAAIRDGGEEELVREHVAELPEDPELAQYFPPALVEVSLESWAREAVEIVLWAESEGPGCGPAPIAWGSPAVESLGPKPPVPGSPARPNVLLVGLDTLRADHLGAYGRDPSVTPALDRLAAESDLFESAFSAFNVTTPSFASIHTGLWGKNHGVYDLSTSLGASQVTLAERFHEGGWRTFAVISAAHMRPEISGLGQGFEGVNEAEGQYAAESAIDQAMGWISSLANTEEPERPFFLWLHLFDVHTPHTPARPWAEGASVEGLPGMSPVESWTSRREAGLREFTAKWLGGQEDLYFDELAYLDHQIDRLYDFLASRGLLETTIVVVVADHGENFGEEGIRFEHAGLWDATLHVPLMIRPPGSPGRSGRRLPGLVQSIDLAPTLLRLAGLQPHAGMDGKDLYELTRNGRGRWAVFAEESNDYARMIRTKEHLFMQTEPIHTYVQGDRLFGLADDPEQTTNLAGKGLPIEQELEALLQRWLRDRRKPPETEAVELSEEDARELRALGYLDG